MRRPWGVLLWGLAVVAFALFLVPKVAHISQLHRRSAALERELARIKADNHRLESELKLLREDPVYLEKVAREKFSMAKKGEIVYKVVREK